MPHLNPGRPGVDRRMADRFMLALAAISGAESQCLADYGSGPSPVLLDDLSRSSVAPEPLKLSADDLERIEAAKAKRARKAQMRRAHGH